MLIDWFTVGAQALNFVVLVWLLERFLYQPILAAIDAREKGIAAEIADAQAKQAEAVKEREVFQRRNEAFAKERAGLFAKAGDEARAEGGKILAEARLASDALILKRKEAMRNDAEGLNQALLLRTRNEVFAIARKVLADLAAADLEERMAAVFIRRLGELDGAARDAFSEAIRSAASPAILRSAFELPREPRAAIQKALNEAFSADVHLRFETSPDLVSGIELVANGRKLAWSIAGYLAALESSVGELVDPEAGPIPAQAIARVAGLAQGKAADGKPA